MDNNEDNYVNKEKKISCEDDRQSEGGEDHLTEQENEDNVVTLGERLNMDEKLGKYIREQPEWMMEKINAISMNIPNSKNVCSDNICVCAPIHRIRKRPDNNNLWECACQQCEEGKQYEGGEDQSETSDESGKDE